ncbi:hypothetical protein ACFQUU_27305 [Herbaspirillum sp. GCM10030257]|uniref:hypothetical protein n=1 Tax=Herbaspirillum sp. GCM10030257 TaxID=3273393 RepID=UPI003613193F
MNAVRDQFFNFSGRTIMGNGVGGVGGGNVHFGGQEVNVKDLKPADLEKIFADPNALQGEKDAALKELLKRLLEEEKAGGPEGAGGGGGQKGKVAELLEKLRDGSITPEEMEELKKLTGKSEEELEKMVKGDGGEGGGGTGGDQI